MKPRVLLFLILSTGLWFSPRAAAGPVSFASIPSLCSSADAVISGSFEVTFTNGTASFTIVPDHVLKGTLVRNIPITVTWTHPSVRMGLPSASLRKLTGHGIFFLQSNPAGVWSFLPTMHGDVNWGSVYVHTPSDVPETVRNTVMATLGNDPSVLDRVAAELLVGLEAGVPTYVDLIGIFRDSRSRVLAAAFPRWMSSKEPRLVTMGFRGAAVSGDAALIPMIQQRYAELSADTGWQGLLEDIRTRYVNTDAVPIRALGHVAEDRNAAIDFRIATASVLARMHTQQALPYLGRLLNDESITLKAMAVGGLSSFANNVPIGSHEPAPGPWKYRTDDTIAHSAFDVGLVAARQAYYVGFWTAWWQQNQDAAR